MNSDIAVCTKCGTPTYGDACDKCKPKKFTYVMGDDWDGLYTEGKLVREGHSFSVRHLFEWLGVDVDIVVADLNWLGERGNLPEDLKDIKHEA